MDSFVASVTYPRKVWNFVHLSWRQKRIYVVTLAMSKVKRCSATAAYAPVPVECVLPIHKVFEIVKCFPGSKLKQVCAVVQRWSVFWRLFLCFLVIEFAPFDCIRCDSLVEASR